MCLTMDSTFDRITNYFYHELVGDEWVRDKVVEAITVYVDGGLQASATAEQRYPFGSAGNGFQTK